MNWRNLSNANLTKAILKDSDLEYANLNYTNLNKSDCEGVNLNKADLSYSCFFKANMRRANLYQSKCYQTDFQEANLESSLFGKSDCLRASFYKSNLRSSVFNGADITFANFQKANLQKSLIYAANAFNCNFFNADLTDACLAAMHGIGANFSEANLTGVCIENWNINASTNLQNIFCDYVYNKSGWDWDGDGEFLPSDRLPHDPAINFKVGEFERFIQKAQNTVDLIFTNGIDWQAFLQAFLKLKSKTGEELSIHSIEDKWDNYFIVRVNVPPDTNKGKLAEALNREYELKEDKKFLHQHITDLTMSLNEALRKKPMSGDTFNINANNSPVSIAKDNATQNIHSINEIFEQHQDISEIAAEIQKLLAQVQDQGLSESDAQEKVADDLANKAKSDSTMMEKLKSLGKSFGSASGKALVTEGVKAVFKLALNKAGIHLE
ncbi:MULTISPECIES: pentapeptide repeat-containing protein [Pseudanabaena]|uniref:pentapeptide repeat-containing protein n=1 Tax=Pseudanabaena TaxID=1152 RepID=UPI00247A439D|nr:MULTISPECIES: pentapeptide repeat-containing protein [Pseudanabaena]MEA5486838.1 pentapeptide repeat-containing protein [Pseudanabaena sp. CCNP1317]WGS73280.1 pentapeptide repeat-containing protein [Pseudanabaena galeata CCNP1313]